MDYGEQITNDLIHNNNIMPLANIEILSKATTKIETQNGDLGSGFFIKFERNKKPFYCLMTNQHVITPKMIENKETIAVNYKKEKGTLILELNKKERIILYFEQKLNLDVTIVEIVPKKDNIKEKYFLSPYTDYDENLNHFEFVGKKIQITQFPEGIELSYSHGIILDIYSQNLNMFFHTSNTKGGSSGSPIVLAGEEKVLAIHKAGNEEIQKNAGIFIKEIVNFFKNYKKNGLGIDYDENGRVKYKGNFLDDEYNGEGTFYYPNGDYYKGNFIKGKKSGRGCDFYKNGKIKYDGKFVNDKYEDNEGTYHFENGEIYIGQFKNGEKNGHGQIYKLDNNTYIKVKEAFYLDDKEYNSNPIQNNNNQNNNNINNNNINNNNINNNNINNIYKNINEIDNNINYNNNINNIINNNINDDNNNEKKDEDKEEEEEEEKYDVLRVFELIKKNGCKILHNFGDELGFPCKDCHHPVSNHTIIKDEFWHCDICPEGKPLCKSL